MPKEISVKSLFSHVKVSIFTGLLVLTLASLSSPKIAKADTVSDSDLIIPEATLDLAFNIQKPEMTSGAFQIPVNYTYMSQRFSSFHPGIDLPSKYGSSIKPIASGIVEEADYSPFGYGNVVIIDNGNGIESLYAHLSKIKVKKGDQVSSFTEIGLVGSSGHSTGPHLHLEIHVNNKAINPLSVLPPINKTQPSSVDTPAVGGPISTTSILP